MPVKQTTQTNISPASTPAPSIMHLTHQDSAAELSQLVELGIAENDTRGIRDLIVQVAEVLRKDCPDLEHTNPELWQKHQQSLIKAKWFLIGLVGSETTEMLFREHFNYFFAYNWQEVFAKLRRSLLANPDPSARDLTKMRWRAAMGQSETLLGEGTIEVAGTPGQRPTVGHWLRDFRNFLHKRPPDELLIVEYLNTTPNLPKQSREVHEQVEHLLKFYVELTKSSTTLEGAEELVTYSDPFSGTYKVVDRGEIRDTGIKIPEENLSAMRELMGLDENGQPLTDVQRVKRAIRSEQASQQEGVGAPQTAALSAGGSPRGESTIAESQTSVSSVSSAATPQPATNTREVFIPEIAPQPPSLPIARPTQGPSQAKTMSQSIVQKPIKPVKSPPLRPQTRPQTTPPALAPQKRGSFAAPFTPFNYAIIAQRVLSAHKLLFPNLEVEQRFLGVMIAYLQGKSPKEKVRESLTQPIELGGTALAPALVDQILDTAEQELLMAQNSVQPSKSNTSGWGAVVPTLDEVSERLQQQEERRAAQRPKIAPEQAPVEDIFAGSSMVLESALPTSKRDLPLPSVQPSSMLPTPPSTSQQPALQTTPPLPSTPQPQQAMRPQPSSTTLSRFRLSAPRKKTIMRDITAPTVASLPTVMGPLDELKNMNLLEFRRLAADPYAAAQKIMYKLQLLEGESVAKRATGIDAWKASPLHQLYLQIGNQSLAQSMSVIAVIKSTRERGVDTLSEREFEAIADLNKQMRY